MPPTTARTGRNKAWIGFSLLVAVLLVGGIAVLLWPTPPPMRGEEIASEFVANNQKLVQQPSPQASAEEWGQLSLKKESLRARQLELLSLLKCLPDQEAISALISMADSHMTLLDDCQYETRPWLRHRESALYGQLVKYAPKSTAARRCIRRFADSPHLDTSPAETTVLTYVVGNEVKEISEKNDSRKRKRCNDILQRTVGDMTLEESIAAYRVGAPLPKNLLRPYFGQSDVLEFCRTCNAIADTKAKRYVCDVVLADEFEWMIFPPYNSKEQRQADVELAAIAKRWVTTYRPIAQNITKDEDRQYPESEDDALGQELRRLAWRFPHSKMAAYFKQQAIAPIPPDIK